MRLSDLLRDDATDRLSSTKLWAHLGNAAIVATFIKVSWGAAVTESLVLLFGVVGGLVSGSAFAHMFVKLRAGRPTTSTETKL